LSWWGIGIAVFGLGTALESAITLAGNSVALTRCWYVAGAVLGAYPLAQGSVHLLLPAPLARRLTAVTLPPVLALSALVLCSPARPEALAPQRPGGAVLGWRWLRLCTPFVNGYAALFLVGGAAWSAWRWRRLPQGGDRALGNALIALGALLPGVGGAFARAGAVEVLYLAELIGIALIAGGYVVCRRSAPAVARGGRATT